MPQVKGFKYVYSVGQIDDMLKKIKDTGRPDALTLTYAQNTWLLKNAQYGSVIDILKDMRFLDANGSPTDLYAQFQNTELEKSVLAIGIRNAYPTLFKAYPQAHNLPKEKLEGYIKQQTGADQSVIQKVYGTFKRLCSLAHFSQLPDFQESHKDKGTGTPVPTPPATGIPITMNIQIAIPSDATAEQYDKIFSSIKKNLCS